MSPISWGDLAIGFALGVIWVIFCMLFDRRR